MSRRERSIHESHEVMRDLSNRIGELIDKEGFDSDGGMTSEDVLQVLNLDISGDDAQSKLAEFSDLSDDRRRAIMIYREWMSLSMQISQSLNHDESTIALRNELAICVCGKDRGND